MKYTLRLPTKDPYAFIEITGEADSVEEVYQGYVGSMTLITGGEGMSEKEMDTWIENMLLENGNSADVYVKSTPAQKIELHRVRRAIKRISARQAKQ